MAVQTKAQNYLFQPQLLPHLLDALEVHLRLTSTNNKLGTKRPLALYKIWCFIRPIVLSSFVYDDTSGEEMKACLDSVLERLKKDDLPLFDGVSAIEVNGRYGAFQETPLHILAIQRDIEGCRLLLDAGAEVDYPGEQGFTALHEAVHLGHPEIVKLLLEYGSDPSLTTELGTTEYLAESYPEILALLKSNTARQ